jgi:hypothetical protein
MKTDTQESIIEHIRSLKEENAAEHGYSLEAIIASARERQEASGRRIIRLHKGEQDGADQPATAPVSKSEGKEKPKPESEVRPQ